MEDTELRPQLNTMAFFDSFTPTCPTCEATIPEEDTNPAKDIAFCRPCNQVHALSALVSREDLLTEVDLSKPPKGISIAKHGTEHIITASYRSFIAACGALGVGLFWNGIVSVFVLIAIGATLMHMGFDIPHWFPAPEMNDEPMSVGMTIFMWLFLTPFIAIGSMFIGGFFMSIMGKAEARIRTQEVSIFTGIGFIGYSRRFNPADVKNVSVIEDYGRHSDDSGEIYIGIELHNGKLYKLGKHLPTERRRYMAALMHKTILNS